MHTSNRGFTLVEVLVFAGLAAMVFVGIVTSFRLALDITAETRAQSTANALVVEQLEFIRSLEYDAVGTVSGIPAGTVPQVSTTTVNGREFTVRTLIYWVDDPSDGMGGADSNGILTDYKEAKVTVEWDTKRTSNSIFALSKITPEGIESAAGGGTLVVDVLDAAFQPVSSADVRLLNETTTSTIDVTQGTNVNGRVRFTGAPTASQYQIFVTRPGYSSSQTYQATTSNPNPDPQPVAVIDGDTSNVTFRIDQVSDLELTAVAPPLLDTVSDDFAPPSTVLASTSVTVVSNALTLTGGPTNYQPTGTAWSAIVSPGTFDRWDTITVRASTTVDTDVRVRVADAVSTSSVSYIPDSALPGNTSGFAPGTIDISSLDPTTYPEVAVVTELSTASSTVTPEVHEWAIQYATTETPRSGVPMRVRSTKTIGADSGGSAIYKYDELHTTDGSGMITLLEQEWDTYRVTPDNAWSVAAACPRLPLELAPGVSEELQLTLVSRPAYSLRVVVEDMTGATIPGATVRLEESVAGLDQTETTGVCGNSFFGTGLVDSDEYVVTVSAPGYTTTQRTDVPATASTTVETITLSP